MDNRTIQMSSHGIQVLPQLSVCSVQFSRSVVSDSLWPHESQHARLPCPSPSPRVHSDSRPLVGDAIQPSHPLLSPFPPAPNPSLVNNCMNVSNSFAAATAAKSHQSCPTLCDPRDGSPSGSPVPGTLQARTLEWVSISLSNAWKWKVKVESLSRVWLLAPPWTAAYQAPWSMGFSRQEYWSGLPLPSSDNSFIGM